MKKSKPALLKNKENLIVEEMDPEKEIELLKKKLKTFEKKYDIEKKRREGTDNDNWSLIKQISTLQKINKAARVRCESKTELYEMMCTAYKKVLDTVQISSRNYCNIISKSNNSNILPRAITDIEFHKAELEKIIDILSSLIKNDDLLASHRISEFLSNQN